MLKKYFGTDGIRGKFGKEITPKLAYEIGRAAAQVFNRENAENVIIVGKDTRLSSASLESALASGITAMGTNVILLGVVPTAVVPFSIPFHKACGAIMITASHNPSTDNGFKFFNGNGFRISTEQENRIENLLAHKTRKIEPYNKLGNIITKRESVENYIKMVRHELKSGAESIKVCIDCANGACSEIAKEIFLKCNCQFVFSKPNGTNINDLCGAIHLENLKNELKSGNFDLGFAFDGDADRVRVVMANGNELSGEEIIYLLTKYNNFKSIVTTKMSNIALSIQLEKENVACNTVGIGESEVIRGLLETKSLFGGENNGHYLFLEKGESSDGLIACAQLMSIFALTRNFNAPFKLFPHFESAVRVKNKNEVMKSKNLENKIELCESLLGENGRILVRASGTESVVRILVEGEDEKLIAEIGETLEKEILSS